MPFGAKSELAMTVVEGAEDCWLAMNAGCPIKAEL